MKWLESQQGTKQCPMCRADWKFKGSIEEPSANETGDNDVAEVDAATLSDQDEETILSDDA